MNDTFIYQFSANEYGRNDVDNFSFEMCEKLANLDETNVTKFDLNINGNPINAMQNLLNDDLLDTENSFYRIFGFGCE